MEGANEKKNKFKVLWDDTQGLLRISCWGDYFEEDAKNLIQEVDKVIGNKKDVSILTDLTGAKTACRAARKIFRSAFSNPRTFKKHAIIIPNPVIKTIVSFVLHTVNPQNVHFFSSEDMALSWLKEHPIQEPKELEPCEKFFSQQLHILLPILQHISTGDFSKRLPIPKNESPLTELFVAINLMTDDLQEYERITREHETILEKKIQERTQELQESEEKYRAIFDNSPVGIGLTSLEGDIIATNATHQKMSGYSEEELRHMPVSMLYQNPKQREEFLTLLKKNGFVANLPIKYRPKDGVIRDVLLNSLFITISGQRLIQTTLIDITQRERLEEALKMSELRYKKLFESSKDGLLILEEDTGIITDINQSLVSLLGYERKEFLEKYIWDSPSLKTLIADKLAFEKLQETWFVRSDDLIIQKKDTTPIEVEFTSSIYALNSHKVIQCTIRDISIRKKIERELKEYTKGLEDMNQIMVGREMKMIELKKEIEKLKKLVVPKTT